MANKSPFNRPRPPRVVYVCGHKIKVKVVPHLVDDDDNELAGAYNGDTKTIFIVKGDDWRTNLWHEILHCCWHLTGAGEGLTMAQEERLTVAAENALGPLFF
jgi:hypothetical protein